MTTRSRFLATTGATFASIGFVRAPAKAATIQWKVAHDQPASHPIGVAANEFAAAVARDSGGRLQFKVFPNSELGGDTQLTAQLRTGALEMNLQSESALSGVAPLTGISRLGFVFNSEKNALAALDGELGDVIRKDIDSKGLFALERAWMAGFRQVTTGTKPIRNANDMAGLKIRVPAGIISTDLFKTLGAAPTPMNSNEMYTALQTHIVDAWEGPYVNIDGYRIYEVQKYISVTNHQFTGYWVTINPAAWQSLPPDLQAIVRKNGNAIAITERRSASLLNASLADKLQRLGMKLNATDAPSFRNKLGPYYARWKNEFGPSAWAALEKYSGKLG
jgi:tripartite ATP-independent transporter DctP family solute receptor